jgi:DNA topoisomerase-1
MSKSVLVIVESPTKAKTIRKFLPKSYVVEASFGHVRDLPESSADIPAAYKKEEWARIGVNVKNDFEPLYVVSKKKTKVISELKSKIKSADLLFLATDEDREGESIAWHLKEILKPKIPVKRMVFHEITKVAIEKALTQTREVDSKLVRAQETRRILDRLYGYTLSPLIWKKIAFGLSAGRVQSVALKLIVDRERARSKFKKGDYWDILADFFTTSADKSKDKNSEQIEARLQSVGGLRVATGKDFDENTGQIVSDKKLGKDLVLLNEKQTLELVEKLKSEKALVKTVTEKPLTNRPAPPFITSTLQQEANRKLGLSAREAMRTAQKLYEEGLITYMRTDSPNLSTEAIQAARDEVVALYGKEYLNPEPRQYTSKSKGAQEAHEAIRPAGNQFVHPKDSGLRGAEAALYELIWKRTMATQMAEAKKLSVSVHIQMGEAGFQASGSRIIFPGFLRAYVEGSDDPDAALEDKEILLPNLKEGQSLFAGKMVPESHETKPPARFTEAALVQTLEKEEIGRPSTYASIIGTIQERGYVRRVAQTLVPTFTGFAVTQLLEKHFPILVDPKFTSKMEDSLDKIAEGDLEWLPYLKNFYLGKEGLETQVKSKEKSIDPDESRTIDLHHLKGTVIKVGRFGPYIVRQGTSDKKSKKTDEIHASIPDEISPADLTEKQIDEFVEIQAQGPKALAVDPKSGKNIYCLLGRFGPYLQLGENPEDPKSEQKPKRASIPKGLDPKTITLEKALELLSLPRELGLFPKNKKPILANNGRFGPYVVCDGDFRSLKKEDNVYTVTLERAIELLSQEKKGRAGSTILKELGQHPTDKKPVQIMEGKYGPYVKHGSVNATIPKGTDPMTLILEEALKLLFERKSKAKTKKK